MTVNLTSTYEYTGPKIDQANYHYLSNGFQSIFNHSFDGEGPVLRSALKGPKGSFHTIHVTNADRHTRPVTSDKQVPCPLRPFSLIYKCDASM